MARKLIQWWRKLVAEIEQATDVRYPMGGR
jgi:hypothetical protein